MTHFAAVAARYGAKYVRADGHYRESISEHLQSSRLYLVPAPEGAVGKAESYQVARSLLLEGRVRLPKHERLLRQLREVVSRPTAGGGVSVSSPRWRTGGHGDIVSALVLALYDASQRPAPVRPDAIDDAEHARRALARHKKEISDRIARQRRRNPFAAIN